MLLNLTISATGGNTLILDEVKSSSVELTASCKMFKKRKANAKELKHRALSQLKRVTYGSPDEMAAIASKVQQTITEVIDCKDKKKNYFEVKGETDSLTFEFDIYL